MPKIHITTDEIWPAYGITERLNTYEKVYEISEERLAYIKKVEDEWWDCQRFLRKLEREEVGN